MIWKPKEEPLTQEQAIDLAKKELAPYWVGVSPMLAGIKDNSNRVTAVPLDKSFTDRSWLMFFLDPTDFNGQTALFFAEEWFRRYSDQNLSTLILFNPPYGYLRTPQGAQEYRKRSNLPFPLVIDAEGLLFQAFSTQAQPKVVLFDKGQPIIERAGKDWSAGLELEIQKFLRTRDPGLPLLPPFSPSTELMVDISKLEFGQGRGAVFPAPGFGPVTGGFATGRFGGRPEGAKSGSFYLKGLWIQDGERIATQDPTAEIGFRCPSSGLALVGESLSKLKEPCKILIEINGISAFDVFAADDLEFDDEGASFVKVGEGNVYRLLTKLTAKEREITLKFPLASHAPVAIYGLRFVGSVGELAGS